MKKTNPPWLPCQTQQQAHKGLCSWPQRPGWPAPWVEEGQPALDPATSCLPFALQTTVSSQQLWGSLQAAGGKVLSVLWGLLSVAAPGLHWHGWEPRQCHLTALQLQGPWDKRTQETPASQAPASGLGPQCCEGQRECPSFLPRYVTSSSIRQLCRICSVPAPVWVVGCMSQ